MRLSRHNLHLTASALAMLVAASGSAAHANTLPSSGSVAAGSATISANSTTLTVNQSSANAVINWQSFSVGAGDKVVFVQPNASSATLNRVTGAMTSVIAGDISATGTVYLINPNGIQITSTGAIAVGRGFVASTLDIADKDFLAGKGTFSGTGGAISAAGSITTQTGGFVGLLAGSVSTSGRILAPAGQVVIGAGTVATLDVNGGGFLQVALPSSAALSADGTTAVVTGGTARDAVRNMVNLPASVNAQSLAGVSGSIDLGGTISVDSATGDAGHIKVLGNSVSGNAALSARATGASGNGGEIETSGNTVDFSGFTITTAAVHGRTGTWLLDPLDLTIDATGATALSNALATNSVILATTGANDSTGTSSATGSAASISPSAYGTASTGNGDINITSAVTWSSTNSLTLQAYNNINISAPITALQGSLVLTAGNGVSQTGTVSASAAVNVGIFSLTNGNWVQNAASLPSFSATDFSFDTNNASFLRVTGGAGSTASPYQITDAYGLQGIDSAALLASSFVVMNNIDATGTSAWNAGAGFLPIGTDASDTIVAGTGFTGSLNGQGHAINGVTVNLSSSDYVGLFGYVGAGGVVQNLGVTAVNMAANSNVGGLVGDNYGTISNSYSTGLINENSAGFTGGLVGQNFGTINGGSYSSAVVKGSDVVGGLVGSNANTGTITNSHATGAVTQGGTVGDGGGLSGQNYGTITDSYATGAVRGGATIGGLVGYNAGLATIQGSHATGQVFGNDPTTGEAGGLVGDNGGTITNDANGASYATGGVTGTINVGGLVGQVDASGTIIGSYATGKVTGSASNIGGLAGNSDGTISQSYATGNVQGANFVGGLVGANYNSISDTYATGAVTSGALKGMANSGGLVGQNAALPGGGTAKIVDSYATGAVTSTVKTATALGGLVGSNLGTITASFFNTQTTGLNDTNGGTGVTTAALQSLATFTGAGWAIDNAGGTSNAWRIYDGSTAPLLRIFLDPLTITGNSSTVTYDGNAHSVSGYTVPAGANSAQILGSTSASLTETNAGNYTAPLTGLYSTQTGYDLTLVPVALTINGAQLTAITAGLTGTTTKTYDGTTSATLNAGNFLLGGFVSGQGASVNQTVGTYASVNAGTGIAVTASLSNSNFIANSGTNLSNYILPTSATGNIGVITPASLTVTYNAATAASVYGTTPSGLTGTVSAVGLVSTDTLGGVTSGTATWSTPATATSNVGAYAITGTGLAGASGNYTFTFAQGIGNATALTINPASLTVIADAQTRTYGASNPALTYTETGLVNGDTLAGNLSTSATSSSNVGNYAIGQGSLAASSNYTLSYTGANLAVTPASLTVTYNATPASSVYGTTPSGLTGTVSAAGLVNSDTLGGVTSGTAIWTTPATATSNVGSYAINGSGLAGASSNYTITFAQAAGNATALTISQAQLTAITAGLTGSTAKTYDGTTTATLTSGNFLLAGFANGQGATVNQTIGTYASANVGSGIAVTASLTGSNFVANAGTNLSNYILPTSATGNIGTITPASLSVIANAQTRTYGATNPALTYSETGLVAGDTLTGTLATTATAASNVGTYAIGQGTLGASSNYTLSFTGANLAVTPASLLVTYNASSATSTYGTTPAGLTGTVTAAGLVNSDTLGGVTSGTAAWTTPATSASNVGAYAINGSGLAGTSSNYTITFAQAPANATALTINPATLTVLYTANTASSIYGTTPGGLSGSVTETGLVNGDTAANVVGGTASWSTSASATSNVGSYAIAGSGVASTSANYTINAVQAASNATALTINPASLTVVADAQTRTYGANNPTLTYTETGLVNGDTLSGTLATTATAASNVGNYAIGQGTLGASSNYTLSFTGANLAVTPASLLVTYNASSATSTYGTTPAGLTGTVTAAGLVNSDTLGGVTSGTAAWTTPATSASNVGSYAINGSGLAGTSSNYTVTFAQAPANATALTINPATLTVLYTANTASSIYGTTPGGLSGSVTETGLVNGDTAANVVGGTASWSTSASTTSNVGSYAIAGNGVASTSANYTINAVQAASNATALTINQASLTVVADAQTRTYGANNPTLTYTETGLVNGDTLSGTLATTATAASNVGTYAIGQGTLGASSNYTLSYTSANLAVTPASLTVTYNATPATFTPGAPLTGLTGTVSTAGLVNNDTLAAVTGGTAAWTTSATVGSTAGIYPIIGSGLTANSGNYTFTFNQAPGNATALTIAASTTTLFGSNTLPQIAPDADGGANAGDRAVVNGNNDVSQLDLDTSATTTPCAPGAICPAHK